MAVKKIIGDIVGFFLASPLRLVALKMKEELRRREGFLIDFAR